MKRRRIILVMMLAVATQIICSCLAYDNRCKSIVRVYCYSEPRLISMWSTSGVRPYHHITFCSGADSPNKMYIYGSREHDSLSRLNNDLHSPYGGSISLYALDRNIDSIELISDKAFDSSHPAGSSLLDLVIVRFNSYYGFIQRGYKSGMNSEYVWGNELKNKDLYVLMGPNYLEFHFEKQPEYDAQHTLQLIVNYSSGEQTSYYADTNFAEYEDTESWANVISRK